MDEKKRILITGASGFIGGFLVEEALRRGYDVWVGIRSGSSRKRLSDKRIRFIDLCYEDKGKLVEQLHEVVAVTGRWHYIIHNAGITKSLNKADFYKVNALYTHMLIEALAETECKPDKFLLMSSLSSFGPVAESSLRPISDNDQQCPDTAYGKSKLEAERFLKSQAYFPYVILRPTGVYGPGDKDYLIEIKSIKSGFDLKTGMKPQMITFIYVKDLAVASFLAIENIAVMNKSYFISDGDVYSDNEFSEIVKQLLGKRFVFSLRLPMFLCYIACFCSGFIGRISGKAMTLNPDKYRILKQRNWMCETEPAYKELGFTSGYNLKSGFEETINFYIETGLL
jgi:Nucleoside-diphosphate-sugar epimerases